MKTDKDLISLVEAYQKIIETHALLKQSLMGEESAYKELKDILQSRFPNVYRLLIQQKYQFKDTNISIYDLNMLLNSLISTKQWWDKYLSIQEIQRLNKIIDNFSDILDRLNGLQTKKEDDNDFRERVALGDPTSIASSEMK